MGTLQTNPPTIPNNVTDSWQPLVERDAMSYYGKNEVTLTRWDDSTTKPAVAQGSMIDIDGSLAYFATEETIGGAPANGTIYLKFTVSGSVVTPEFSGEAPTWYADKAGWYNAAGERYSGHYMTLSGTEYSEKLRGSDGPDGLQTAIGSDGGIRTDNATMKCKIFSGTLSNTTYVTHGLNWNDIYGIDYCLRDEYGDYVTGGDAWTSVATKAVAFDETRIRIIASNTYIGRQYRLTCWYIVR